jgi:hypothetical protein
VLTPAAPLLHDALDATIRTTFVDANPTPASCNEHASDNVHDVAPVNGPEIWNTPTRKLWLFSDAQHKWKLAVASPPVAVPRLNSRYSPPDALTEKEAPTYPIGAGDAVEHDAPLATTLTLFELANPVPVS